MNMAKQNLLVDGNLINANLINEAVTKSVRDMSLSELNGKALLLAHPKVIFERQQLHNRVQNCCSLQSYFEQCYVSFIKIIIKPIAKKSPKCTSESLHHSRAVNNKNGLKFIIILKICLFGYFH